MPIPDANEFRSIEFLGKRLQMGKQALHMTTEIEEQIYDPMSLALMEMNIPVIRYLCQVNAFDLSSFLNDHSFPLECHKTLLEFGAKYENGYHWYRSNLSDENTIKMMVDLNIPVTGKQANKLFMEAISNGYLSYKHLKSLVQPNRKILSVCINQGYLSCALMFIPMVHVDVNCLYLANKYKYSVDDNDKINAIISQIEDKIKLFSI